MLVSCHSFGLTHPWPLHLTRVGLIGKANDHQVAATLQALADYLDRRQVEFLLDDGVADWFPVRSPVVNGTRWPGNAILPSWSAVTEPC